MVWIPAIIGLLVGAAVSGGVVGMAMKVREAIVVQGAVRSAKDAATIACNGRVAQISSVHNAAVEEAARRAVEATAGISDPESRVELLALCKASASCRSRGTLP